MKDSKGGEAGTEDSKGGGGREGRVGWLVGRLINKG